MTLRQTGSRLAVPSAPSITVSVSYGLSRQGLPAPASFRRWAEAALVGRIRRADLVIRVVAEKEALALNRHYRGKDYPANVLAFPAELPPGVPLPVLGDIVLCAPVIAREAVQQNKPLANHYAHLTIHGILHLLGFDHEDETDAQAMEALEIQILDTLEISNPYE